MASELPLIPRITFTIIEPISLIGGFIGANIDPEWFLREQLPGKLVLPASEHHIVTARLLGNAYLILCMLGLAIFATTSEIKVVKAYLVALWLGDIAHVAFTCFALDQELLAAPKSWNAMTWGNVGFTVWLFAMRSAYLSGLFGSNEEAASKTKGKKKAA